MHALGFALLNIYEKKLYTQKTADGKPVYDSWTKFCSKEVGINPRYAYRLMDISIHFTKKDVAEVGVSKLNLIVRVPEEKRKALLEKAANTPRSKLSKEVAKLAGNSTRKTGREGFRGTPGTTAGQPRSTKLTIVRSEPRVVVGLFESDGTTPATEAVNATGIEQCANSMVIHYSLMVDKEGRISLAIETRREE